MNKLNSLLVLGKMPVDSTLPIPKQEARPGAKLDELEIEVIDFFIRGVQVVGLPKSIGEIYGILYISSEPMSLDALAGKLEISKGSASQGLRFLRNLGAVNPTYVAGDRRDHFVAETSLKKLMGGFLKNEIGPHLESGATRLERLTKLIASSESKQAKFRKQRIAQLGHWRSKGRTLLGLVEKFLR